MKRRRRRLAARPLLPLALICSAAPAFAQDSDEPEETAPPPVAAEAPAAAGGGRSYTPADFARFAPRNAYDMLTNVPGFSVDVGDTQRRGLGQATGNVLINGERWVGKSTDIETELRRISASNVARIDVVDAATLNISGLSGQVANIVTLSQGLSGNFRWSPQIRARRTPPRLLDGEVSLNGTLGGTQFTLSFRNESYRNGNAGPEIVSTPAGEILDVRDEVLFVNQDFPRLSGSIRRAFGDGSILNANAALGFVISDIGEDSLRSGPGQPDRVRILREREREHNYEFGGDYEFGLAGGRLKFIGLRRFEHSPYTQTLFQNFADGRATQGDRFTQVADETETIARAEYRWSGGRNDWQISAEGAINELDVENGLFSLQEGEFVAIPFPNSAATVRERRAEAILTYGRPLSPTLTLQAAAGAEYSNLVQEGASGLNRTFYRPKGFINLAWQPRPGLDISARIERAVGQLNFFDFVASANVSGGTTNAGNANLVPPQSWEAQVQATKNLGAWGTATARLYGRLITDVVDIIPVGENGQSPGNLEDTATLIGLQWTSTFNFDPIGWRGAKLDMNLQFQHHSLRDPLIFVWRPFNETMTRQIDITLRHDIPGSDWAWGATAFQYRQSAGFRLDQRFQFLDTPGSLGVFVEHKDVMGMTVRAAVDNLLGTNESFSRTFFDGRRNATNSNILFTEDRDRFYGPVFTLTISGTI